jgi:iron complex transport system substrate-binding protein
MRLRLALLLALVAPTAARAEAPPPRRIMSIMMCNDLMLLAMVPKSRITSITYLAHDAVEAIMPGADKGVAINHGTAEEVLRDKPDLVLAGTFSALVARRLAKQVGARVVEIDDVNSFDDIRRVTRQVGALVGASAKAEAMIAGMDRTLAELAATRPVRTVPVVAWSGNGNVGGRGTLFDEVIRIAGGDNVAVKLADSSYSTFGTEELLAARPAAILIGLNSWAKPSLASGLTRHPLVRRLYDARTISYPVPPMTCGMPQAAGVVRDLRRALAALPPGRPTW